MNREQSCKSPGDSGFPKIGNSMIFGNFIRRDWYINPYSSVLSFSLFELFDMEMSRFLLTFLFCIVKWQIVSSATTTVTTPPTTTATTTATVTCPVGWSQFGGECYKYFDNSVKWDEAREHCLSEKVVILLDCLLNLSFFSSG